MKKIDALAAMMECFPASQVTPAMSATFLEAAQGVSEEAVDRCCADFRHGRVDRKRNEFIPSTAQFSKHLTKVQAEIRAREYEASRKKALPDPEKVISSEERERVAEKFAYLKEHGLDATAKKYGIGSEAT